MPFECRINNFYNNTFEDLYALVYTSRWQPSFLKPFENYLQSFGRNILPKIRQRTALGWKEVHEELSKQPFCHNRQQLVRLIMCLECSYCRWEGLCYPCFNQGIQHKLFYTPPIENITLVKYALILSTGTAHITSSKSL